MKPTRPVNHAQRRRAIQFARGEKTLCTGCAFAPVATRLRDCNNCKRAAKMAESYYRWMVANGELLLEETTALA